MVSKDADFPDWMDWWCQVLEHFNLQFQSQELDLKAVRDFSTLDRPMLGICLGMQLLADFSYEGAGARGLGLIPGKAIPEIKN